MGVCSKQGALKKYIWKVHAIKYDKCASLSLQYKATHKSAYSRGYHKASVNFLALSTLQPESVFYTTTFRSLKRCNSCKVV
jgi:hypothetical protein